MWLTLAPISKIAETFYGVSSTAVALFSMSYMIMFIVFAIPASWVIDRYGFRASLLIGALITGIFGVVRAVFFKDFAIVLTSQFALAIAQPFLLNITTKVPATWFPLNERATAAGILTMAQYLGFAVPMLLAPILAERFGIQTVYICFALFAAASALVAIVFAKENKAPDFLASSVDKERLTWVALIKLTKKPPYLLVLFICFISMGAFNTLLSLIETILLPRGITSIQAGLAGAIFVIAGIVGAVVLPLISDRSRVRVPFFIGAISILGPLYLGFTFVKGIVGILLLSGATGFVIMGVAPILFQYGSEAAYPVSEGTSLGIILLMGQISGILFVLTFEGFIALTGSTMYPMLLLVLLALAEIPLTMKMKETALKE